MSFYKRMLRLHQWSKNAHYILKQTSGKLLAWADKFDKDNSFAGQRRAFHEIIENPNNNWHRLIKSLWTDIDPEVRKVFFENFIVNASLVGNGKLVKARQERNCNIPSAILMDPTSACNLHCAGCWAAEYGNKLNMSYETLDDIILQGKYLGTYMYLYSAGEPLVRKDDIIRLCEAHPDCMFLAFTNGTLIDEKFADEMLRVKNFVPDDSLFDALKAAAASCVDVEIMLPLVKSSFFLEPVSDFYANELVPYGAKIHKYKGYIHAKTMLIDGEIC